MQWYTVLWGWSLGMHWKLYDVGMLRPEITAQETNIQCMVLSRIGVICEANSKAIKTEMAKILEAYNMATLVTARR